MDEVVALEGTSNNRSKEMTVRMATEDGAATQSLLLKGSCSSRS